MPEVVVGAVSPTRADPPTASTCAPAVELVSVTRRFGEVRAVADLSLAVRHNEFFSMLGPSGCGKTTLLRLVAGLDLPDAGMVRIGGRDATLTPAHERPVNTVFQSYALFPHLSVRENVAFGLRMTKVPRSDLETRVARALDLVQVAELASRRPDQLSGGQKQRVALARAIVNEPQVLLLDEPLGALDVRLRKELQVQLQSLQRRLRTTFIHVTHDQPEALALSDRIAVMNVGRIEQVGTPEELYACPRNRYVARFLASSNLIEGTVASVYGDGFRVRTAFAELTVQPASVRRRLATGEPCTLAVRPEQVALGDQTSRFPSNWARARVRHMTYTGSETEYGVQLGQQSITAKAFNGSGTSRGYAVGDEVVVHLPATALVLLED